MNKILIIMILVCSLFASESSDSRVKVLGETTVEINGFKYDIYRIQTICKDGYQYTVVIKGSSISITQDFRSFSSSSTDPRVVECDKKLNNYEKLLK
jgi:hypothetical protein